MNIILNGASHAIEDGASIATLIEQLGLVGQRLAVEVNGEIVPRGEHAAHLLREGDKVEVVRAIGGG
ncbi:sulfur carrier protein ThiS [Thiofaba sp. EF100]|jgi:sulfur carrier protein|uniref:sulfur carrier protein ThiS n=1 Tax=Thiofaba sp. EF100 TaxID=3121274 RepID=UPI003221CAE4